MSVGTYGALNGYWGQYGDPAIERLANHCDTGIEYVTLGFVNVSPENDPSGYPGTNFAGHCWATTYENEDGVSSKLLDHCASIQEDIPYCQSKGVKVLLSVGGHYSEESNYEVTGEENGVEFAKFLYSAFGPYDEDWTGPRPFDSEENETHPAVDGFDFDIEADLDNSGYIAMVETLRSLDPSLFISAAPQCPTGDDFFYLKDLISEAEFDALFIQYYNNPQCELTAGPVNYLEWADILAESSKSKNAKLFIGIPSHPEAAGSGYLEPEQLKAAICALSQADLPNWGGISLWELGRGAENMVGSQSYNEYAQGLLLGIGCPNVQPPPTATAPPTVTPPPAGNGTVTTSTVYSTKTHTVGCPPEVKCPNGKQTITEIVPIYTTVCPVGWKPTDAPQPPKETGVPHPPIVKPPPTENKPELPPAGEKPPTHGEKPPTGSEKPPTHGGEPPAHQTEVKPPKPTSPPYTTTKVCYGADCPGGKPPAPTGGVVPKPPNPSEVPVTGAASNVVAGVTGLMIVAALQILVL